MNFNIESLQKELCGQLCATVSLSYKSDQLICLETPFLFPDGDSYQLYIRELPGGLIRLTDCGHTFMHLSYEMDLDVLQKEGNRRTILHQVLTETGILEADGELYIDLPVSDLGTGIFRIGMVVTKIMDLNFLNRVRVESTFYEDFESVLFKILPEESVQKEYICSSMENAQDYPIDYFTPGKQLPLYLFGIPHRDKARLVTITLERLLRFAPNFDSLLVFSDQGNIPKSDLARLSNVGGEMIASLDAIEDLTRKIQRKR